MRFVALLLTVFVLLTAPLAGRAAVTPQDLVSKMAAHKALYNIQMVSKSSGSQILNISGQMFYEWHPGCDAWTTDHRFNLLYEYADSSPIRITSDFSTYEMINGKSFDFTSRRKRNGELYQEIRGRAEMNDDGTGTATFTKPDGLVFDLKKGTLFPMAHSLAVLATAVNGGKFYNAVVFDGSDEDGPVEINAFIGNKINADPIIAKSDDIDRDLIKGPAWRVRMAFFPLLETNSDAEYEMDVIFHENGVISDMKVEYRDFSVTQKLAALEKLEPEKCGNSAKN